MDCIIAILVPLLMTAGITDPAIARRAAVSTVQAYNSAGPDQLVSIAQLVGFALTSLDNLRLSTPEQMSVPLKLKLRGNANALNLSSHRAAKALDSQRRTIAPAAEPAKQETPPAQPRERQPRERQPRERQAGERQAGPSWSDAMEHVADEFKAELDQLPPEQRKAQMRRIEALVDVARTLNKPSPNTGPRMTGPNMPGSGMTGPHVPSPRMTDPRIAAKPELSLRARLLGTTAPQPASNTG